MSVQLVLRRGIKVKIPSTPISLNLDKYRKKEKYKDIHS